MDRNRPVLGGPVRSPQYTGCGPRLPVLGAKNRTELNLRTLVGVGGRGMSAEDGCGRLSSFAVVSCDDDEQ
ncbi:hypothetical protein K443DRAFT_113763 [Laccaria amethystina LaAM-08-1]|uniref:Unplaced genomic scaffold K443scaffold_383, whole genome shotgun sequence n=1 Tax=Laccaria amethystina LaAM-08-1 TaxID=1095629 RepID=A0A0C9WNW3_9AGAR|nr:hypothetical protein K443DRAFT_113763 [Laccaria amethystina LaAM-08-1]